MLDSGLFLIVNLGILWVIYWSAKQDALSKRDGPNKTDVVS
jgi:hypothetical protein